ncbi:hypothetical protein E2C01_078491 [Portunus trituberculatus]|uniref:Uncharacterized protein n=1 Tax=Portunus trituberculatus TaxID=210409 RepID=A0A5B7IN08_PORTR|nr:hypothetical protein [Portunus trituberculatus]
MFKIVFTLLKENKLPKRGRDKPLSVTDNSQ